MKLLRVFAVIISLLFISCASNLKLATPTEIPTSPDETQIQMIKDGIELHDQGEYKEAIKNYNEVLKANPQNVWALYEKSYTYFAMKNYEKSLDICLEAAKYKSQYLPYIYVQIGTIFDILKKPDESIMAYKKGIEQDPDNYLLHFNLGITLQNNNQIDQARKSFKKSVMIKPDHPSSHLALGEIYYNERYRMPALMSFFRFLILEPTSARSSGVVEKVQKLMGEGVEVKNEKKTEINLFVSSDTPTYDGDFGAEDLALTMSRALRYTEESKGKSEFQLLAGELESLFQIMYEIAGKKNEGFAREYYAPYFIELKQRGFLLPFVNHIFRLAKFPEIEKWINSNQVEYQKFLDWSKEYPFPKSL